MYKKEGQQLKYIDKQSMHRPATFWSITSGALKRLSRLTLKLESLQDVHMDKVYPGHANALQKAGLGE
eukprot:6389317-Ditylum_brightwellii.AAC.1